MPKKHPAPAPTLPVTVGGDVSIDWLAWPVPARESPVDANWRALPGTRMVARPGGALLLARMLRAALGEDGVCAPALHDLETIAADRQLHSMVDLTEQRDKAWWIDRLRGFAGPRQGHPKAPAPDRPICPGGILVLDDGGNGFRSDPENWQDLVAGAQPRWLVVKTHRPLADGRLWQAVTAGGAQSPARHLVVVVSSEDLRAEGVVLSRGLSWEHTSEDFVRELGSNRRLAALAEFGHLVVRFDCEAAMHVHAGGTDAPLLLFDRTLAEGDLVASQAGRMMGLSAAFTAGLVAAMARAPDAGPRHALAHALAATRRLARTGFTADGGDEPDYPVAQLAGAAGGDHSLAEVALPVDMIRHGSPWSILAQVLGDPRGVAEQLVREGPEAALRGIPFAVIGDLATADRGEIETFRAIGTLLRQYLGSRPTRPMSIGVFGPPGAGKSFCVWQLAKAANRGTDMPRLTFNLSQFGGREELLSALHLTRDRAIAGSIPLVFFDEFDCEMNGRLGWLRHFLAPMQDGSFYGHGHTHPIGPAVFVFAGGTAATFRNFAAPLDLDEADPARRAFVDAKGPDFISRLQGVIDIPGPNDIADGAADRPDMSWPLRRAFVLRAKLVAREKGLLTRNRIAIDPGVLHALLTVPRYRHGVRSIEAILAMSSLSGRRRFDRADLPPAQQLTLHVDPERFVRQMSERS